MTIDCRECGYKLDPNRGRCPECGTTFDARDPRSFHVRGECRRRRRIGVTVAALIVGAIIGLFAVFVWLMIEAFISGWNV